MENTCDDTLILDQEQIQEDFKFLKGSSKTSRTILFAIRHAEKHHGKNGTKVSYASFMVGLQMCKLKSSQEISIKKFVLERCYTDRKIEIWSPLLFISIVTLMQTTFLVTHTLYLNIVHKISLFDTVLNLNSIPESYHRKNPIYDVLVDDPKHTLQLWRYFSTVFLYTDIYRYCLLYTSDAADE